MGEGGHVGDTMIIVVIPPLIRYSEFFFQPRHEFRAPGGTAGNWSSLGEAFGSGVWSCIIGLAGWGETRTNSDVWVADTDTICRPVGGLN